jgi:hypothetical protein
MKRMISVMLVMALMMTGFAPVVFGEMTAEEKKQKAAEDICSFAQEDASYTQNQCLWQAAGFVLGPIGVLLGCFIIPPVQPSRIMGRPSDYVEQYTKCYTDTLRWNQLLNSGLYCAYSAVFFGGIYFLFLSHH